MTIDRGDLRETAEFCKGDPYAHIADAETVLTLLDSLDAAEHRATRAEAQSAIRGRAVLIYQQRAREAEAERERDEYRRSLERWRESAIRGRKERDEAKKFAGLWKEATRRTIRHAERKDEVLDAWRTRALDAEERERILIAERARRGEVCPDKDAHWRLDEALADLQAAEDRAEQAVRDLHERAWNGELDYCPRCLDYDGAIWPCKTIRILEGDTDG